MLPSVTNLAPLQQRSQRLSKLGCGRASEKDGCRGEGQPVQQGVGQWRECLASLAASAPAARQGGGAGGGSALMGSNLQ